MEASSSAQPPVKRPRMDDHPQGASSTAAAALTEAQVLASCPPSVRRVMENRANRKATQRYAKTLIFGDYSMDAWHPPPYPPEAVGDEDVIHVCSNCFLYFPDAHMCAKHSTVISGSPHCAPRPPGQEVYRAPFRSKLSALDAATSIHLFAVRGDTYTTYSQCLCLFARSFIGDKAIADAVQPFVFLLCCVRLRERFQFLGYFSRLIEGDGGGSRPNNLACIMVLPPFMGAGIGSLLIATSYALRKRGGPERPLSAHGAAAFHHYWKILVLDCILQFVATSLGLDPQNRASSGPLLRSRAKPAAPSPGDGARAAQALIEAAKDAAAAKVPQQRGRGGVNSARSPLVPDDSSAELLAACVPGTAESSATPLSPFLSPDIVEKYVGSPVHPAVSASVFSDWVSAPYVLPALRELFSAAPPLSAGELWRLAGIHPVDLCSCLAAMKWLVYSPSTKTHMCRISVDALTTHVFRRLHDLATHKTSQSIPPRGSLHVSRLHAQDLVILT